jgi:hypothetical protein
VFVSLTRREPVRFFLPPLGGMGFGAVDASVVALARPARESNYKRRPVYLGGVKGQTRFEFLKQLRIVGCLQFAPGFAKFFCHMLEDGISLGRKKVLPGSTGGVLSSFQ